MKRTRRVAGLITIGLVMASFLVIGCGDSATGPIIAGDDDGVYVPPGHTGGGPDVKINEKGNNDQK
jgi:hypothetical protein